MGHKKDIRIVPIIQLNLLMQDGLYCILDEAIK
jgi:hypothetical protein